MEAFKSLIVWQKSMELVRMVYQLTKGFPADEHYALTDQLRRAVVSIPSNIAEGSGRASNMVRSTLPLQLSTTPKYSR